MTQDSEKRFHSIMNIEQALSESTNHCQHNSSEYNCREGKKRPYSSSDMVVGGLRSKNYAPLCRPWDRGDLSNRLTTFKSMSWFGKPKVVNAINCARRGWINVDMDTIACVSCGARLLFSTPSSWNQQQCMLLNPSFSLLHLPVKHVQFKLLAVSLRREIRAGVIVEAYYEERIMNFGLFYEIRY